MPRWHAKSSGRVVISIINGRGRKGKERVGLRRIVERQKGKGVGGGISGRKAIVAENINVIIIIDRRNIFLMYIDQRGQIRGGPNCRGWAKWWGYHD